MPYIQIQIVIKTEFFSHALPKEASGNDLSWAYAMKNDLLGGVETWIGFYSIYRMSIVNYLLQKDSCKNESWSI